MHNVSSSRSNFHTVKYLRFLYEHPSQTINLTQDFCMSSCNFHLKEECRQGYANHQCHKAQDMNRFLLPLFFFFIYFLEGLDIHPVLFPSLRHSSKLVIFLLKAVPQKGKARQGPLSRGSTGWDASSLFASSWAWAPLLCSPTTTTWRNKPLIPVPEAFSCRDGWDHQQCSVLA